MITSLRMLQVMNLRVTATTRLIRCSQAAAPPFATRRPLCKLWAIVYFANTLGLKIGPRRCL